MWSDEAACLNVCLTREHFLFSFSFFLSAQWDAINEMDEYFTPIHTYQVRVGLTLTADARPGV